MRLSYLQPIVDRPGPWASVYADVTHSTEDAAKQLELTAGALAGRLSELGAPIATCDAVYDALIAVRTDGQPGGHAGRAVFAAEGEVVLDTPLAGPPPTTFAEWSLVPRVAPLLDAVGEDPRCLLAYVDRTGADFELRSDSGGGTAGHAGGADWPIHRTASADWSEHRFQTRVENTWEQNAAEIAEAARRTFDHHGASVLLLAGEARECRAVRDHLPEPLRSVTFHSEHGGRARGADSALLERDIAQVRAAVELDHVAGALDRYRAGAAGGSDGGHTYAAAGVPALVEAAREHRIGTLLVAPGSADTGREVWVGSEPDQLAVRGTELRYLGETDPAPARADDALVRSAVANGGEAVVVRDPADAPTGGLGAILRWAAPERH